MTTTQQLLDQRREIARRIDRAVGEHPDVTAVYVLGSVATGHVDERSDVDISVVCRPSVLPQDTRRELLSQIGTDWQIGASWSNDPIWKGNAMPTDGDEGVVEEVTVGLIYQSASTLSRVVEQVINEGAITTEEIPFRPYTLVGMLRQSWLLRDRDGLFKGWLEQTETYPHLLKLNVLHHFVPVLQENAEAVKECAERRLGASAYIFFLTRACDAMESILYALNEIYDPADKRAERTILPTLANVPRDFMARYTHVVEGPFDQVGALERARVFEDLTADVLRMAGEVARDLATSHGPRPPVETQSGRFRASEGSENT